MDSSNDPRIDIVLERCRQLDIPTTTKTGNHYSFRTLRSSCMKRKIEGRDAIPRLYLALNKRPSYLPSNFIVGHIETGPTGIPYIVSQDRLKRRYWKMLPFRGDKNSEQSLIGGGISILSDTRLKRYLDAHSITKLLPDTMIPSDILVKLVPTRIDLNKLAAKYDYLPFSVIM